MRLRQPQTPLPRFCSPEARVAGSSNILRERNWLIVTLLKSCEAFRPVADGPGKDAV